MYAGHFSTLSITISKVTVASSVGIKNRYSKYETVGNLD